MIQCRTIVNNGPLGLVIRRPVRYAGHMRYSDSSWLTAAGAGSPRASVLAAAVLFGSGSESLEVVQRDR